MKQIALLALGLLATLGVEAQTYKFDFTTGKKLRRLYQNNSADRYSEERDYTVCMMYPSAASWTNSKNTTT